LAMSALIIMLNLIGMNNLAETLLLGLLYQENLGYAKHN